ncbi:MAG: MBOAT family protein, partial [Muribaculaceae bacterium]|nr:MBOAT family protein [Muribaculaceae bacterium]
MTLWTDLARNLGEVLSYTPGNPMLFSSGLFWGLFLLFLPLYSLLRDRRWQMISFLVVFSFYFYYRCSGWFVLLL